MSADPFLLKRGFEDCIDRLSLIQRRFESALLIGCPDPTWPQQLNTRATGVTVVDPGPEFARRSHGQQVEEDAWVPPEAAFDLIVAAGTLDSVNGLPLALRLLRHALKPDSLMMGYFFGGETLPRLRTAMRAADAQTNSAMPHVHPRIEASALAPLLADAGLVNPVVDIDRVRLSYTSLGDLVRDLRAMGATNILTARPQRLTRSMLNAAEDSFRAAGDGGRTVETIEILHFAAWSGKQG